MTPSRRIRQKLIWQLELTLYSLLEVANKKFTKAIESGTKETDTFAKIANGYKKIVQLIEHNRQISVTSALLEFYYLEAKLGVLQSNTNSLAQEPITQETVLNNDRKLDEIKESLDKLYSKVTAFSKKISLDKKNKFKLDCEDLITKIQEYYHAWPITANQRKAIYYYNYALHLIEHANVKNIEKSIYILKQSIKYLELSCNEYRGIPESKEDIETVVRLIKKTNRKIQALTPLQTRNKEERKTQNRPASDKPRSAVTDEAANAFYPQAIAGTAALTWQEAPAQPQNRLALDNRQIQAHSSITAKLLPSGELIPKKRKLPQSKQEFSSKKHKSELANKITRHDFLSDLEEQAQAWEEEIKKSLKQIPLDSNTYLHYSTLFFKLANNITTVSKESANHSLLTKLSWLDIAKNLMALSPNKDIPLNENITSQITSLTKKYYKQLRKISIQKRAAAYPSYSELYLKTGNPHDLLSTEVLDYHSGLEAFKLHDEGISFMSAIPKLINDECQHRFTIPTMLKQIESSTHSLDKSSKNFFYAKLLRELVKFYIFPGNKVWLSTQIALDASWNDELNKLLTAAASFAKTAGPEGIEITGKITNLKDHLHPNRPDKNAHPVVAATTFFGPSTTTTLESVLEKHLQFIVKLRRPSINPEIISKHILQFIQQQCKEHSEYLAVLQTRLLQCI